LIEKKFNTSTQGKARITLEEIGKKAG